MSTYISYPVPLQPPENNFFFDRIQGSKENLGVRTEGLIRVHLCWADDSDVFRSREHCSFYPALSKMATEQPNISQCMVLSDREYIPEFIISLWRCYKGLLLLFRKKFHQKRTYLKINLN